MIYVVFLWQVSKTASDSIKTGIEHNFSSVFEKIKSLGYDLKGLQFAVEEQKKEGQTVAYAISFFSQSPVLGGTMSTSRTTYHFPANFSNISLADNLLSDLSKNNPTFTIICTDNSGEKHTLKITLSPYGDNKALAKINFEMPGMHPYKPVEFGIEKIRDKRQSFTL
ncbi:MAG: hypothetical protein ABIH83_03310 [Candidatus Micrarchaeota archaeon]